METLTEEVVSESSENSVNTETKVDGNDGRICGSTNETQASQRSGT